MGLTAGRGAGLFATAFLAGGAFLGGAFFATAFLAGAFAGATFFAGCFLAAEGREAIGGRLPVETATDTCAYRFTRSCRPSQSFRLARAEAPENGARATEADPDARAQGAAGPPVTARARPGGADTTGGYDIPPTGCQLAAL
ncbi:hypothetical protein GCM10023220_62380 [Streptomyces ziwulingensis]|uniref:Uncharacterized protein n=1 Tax=Streptomyces ziwulingensis TaxID=1045501 RepID=A0ABP9CWW5_9ACTN